jgi:hypothetical protein
MIGFGRWTFGGGDQDSEWDATTSLHRADEDPQAKARPDTVEPLYVENEYHELADAQPHAYDAKGTEEARSPGKQAAGLGHDACEATGASLRAGSEASDASARQKLARDVLGPHRRRANGTKFIKHIFTIVMFGGEGGAVYGAIKLLGEKPLFATFQGASVGATAVVLGFIGREFKHLQAARSRQIPAEEMSAEQKTFYSFFNGYKSATGIVLLVGLACLLGTFSIALGISELRNDLQGHSAAVAWFCFALAFGVGSFANSYHAADEVADFLEHANNELEQADKKAETKRQAPVIRMHAEAETEHDAIIHRSTSEGKAATKHVLARLWGVLASNPDVAGHGTAPKTATHDANTNGHGNPEQLEIKDVVR